MAKFDLENLLDKVQVFLAGSLNTQISALNTEKNDGIVLKTVGSEAYHLQYPGDRAELQDPFVIYEEASEPHIDVSGGLYATVNQIGITIVLVDNGQDVNIVRRLFRYRRALIDLVLTNWASMVGEYKFELSAWSPSPPFKDMNTGYVGRAVGIVLSVEMTD